jgi:hypothetical protein
MNRQALLFFLTELKAGRKKNSTSCIDMGLTFFLLESNLPYIAAYFLSSSNLVVLSSNGCITLWNQTISSIIKYSSYQQLGLCYLTPLSIIFQLYRGSQLNWWRKPDDPGENHRSVASHWQTSSHNVVSSTPCLSGIQTHNISGDRHRLLR